MSYRIYDELRRGLILHLPLSEGIGTIVRDTSQNRISGYFVGDPTWVEGRKGGRAISFDGDDFIHLGGKTPAFDVPAITVACRIKPASVGGENWIWGNGAQFRVFAVAGGVFGFWIREKLGGLTNQITGGVCVADEEYHVVGTYEGLNGWQRLYVNGLQVAAVNPGLDDLDDGSDNLSIGRAYIGSAGHFTGIVYSARMYDRVLNPIETRNLYNLREVI